MVVQPLKAKACNQNVKYQNYKRLEQFAPGAESMGLGEKPSHEPPWTPAHTHFCLLPTTLNSQEP